MDFHSISMRDIKGQMVSFDAFKGKTCLIVNVASHCGMTPQYEGLEAIYASNKDRDFTILGFPCNQFGEQEPGSDEEICEFAESTYQTTFPLFSKVEVNGPNECELYEWLKSEKPRASGKSEIAWNFTKFLIDGEGKVVARFEPRTTPEEIEKWMQEMG